MPAALAPFLTTTTSRALGHILVAAKGRRPGLPVNRAQRPLTCKDHSRPARAITGFRWPVHYGVYREPETEFYDVDALRDGCTQCHGDPALSADELARIDALRDGRERLQRAVDQASLERSRSSSAENDDPPD